MTKNCVFCNLKDEIIYENKYFFAVFDIYPVSPGHALIITKNHIVSLLDLKPLQWAQLHKAIKEVIKKIENTNFEKLYEEIKTKKLTKKSTAYSKKMLKHKSIKQKPQGYNIGNNEGEIAGRTINHLHIQIIPRYEEDVKNPKGGIRWVIPKLADYTK
jgi:diadenosine tetraphosphate (Ap4A) HIT family hydrolase